MESPVAPEPVKSAAPLETTDLKFLDPASVQFFRHGALLRLTLRDDCSYLRTSVVRAFPLSDPVRYYSVRDSENNEIGIIVDPEKLDPDSQKLIAEDLERRYMAPVIQRVRGIKERFGTLEWNVETDRGPRKFTTRNPRENSVMLSPERYLVTDVDGNRYEIKNVTDVDPDGLLLRYL